MDLNTVWDACVIGNGVSSLLTCHYLWSNKKSVLWIASDPVSLPAHALSSHAWHWGAAPDQARQLFGEVSTPFQAIYYDAKSSKRFKPFLEAKKEFGDQEKHYFEELTTLLQKNPVDLWSSYQKIAGFYAAPNESSGMSSTELFSQPRFVRLQGWPVVELKTEKDQIKKVVLAMPGNKEVELSAEKFILGDFDESFPEVAPALKGRAFKTGFGVRFWHKNIPQIMNEFCVLPLIVSPKSGESAHIAGRFLTSEHLWDSNAGEELIQSIWFGFLTDEELEDNNEILKKIKLTRRAVDRAIPGFHDSIVREAITFEPKMKAELLVKKAAKSILGADLITDYLGLDSALDTLIHFFGEMHEGAFAKWPPHKNDPSDLTLADN